MKTINQFTTDLSCLVESTPEESLKIISVIIYNPLRHVDSEEYSDASMHQRAIYLKSKCKEAEIVISTLSKMFEGEILNLEISGLNIAVPCVLRTHKKLTSKECGHITSISPHLEII